MYNGFIFFVYDAWCGFKFFIYQLKILQTYDIFLCTCNLKR